MTLQSLALGPPAGVKQKVLPDTARAGVSRSSAYVYNMYSQAAPQTLLLCLLARAAVAASSSH